MAEKIVRVDDFDLETTHGVDPHEFSLGEVRYTADLTQEHWDKLEDSLSFVRQVLRNARKDYPPTTTTAPPHVKPPKIKVGLKAALLHILNEMPAGTKFTSHDMWDRLNHQWASASVNGALSLMARHERNIVRIDKVVLRHPLLERAARVSVYQKH